MTEVPTSGNEPHHVGITGPSAEVLGAGGLLSVLKQQPEWYFFSLSDPTKPTLVTSSDPPLGGCADDLRPYEDGFLATEMCSPAGGAPGRVAKFNSSLMLVGEFPMDPPAGLNPHGITIDPSRQRMVTSDFIVPSTTLAPSTAPTFRSTFRVWDLANMSIIYTGDLCRNASGIIDARLLRNSGVVILSSGQGVLYGVDILEPTHPVAFTAGGTFHEMFAPFANGTRLLVTLINDSLVQLYDSSDPWHLHLLQEYQMPPGSSPHFVSISPDERMAFVSTYFLDEGSKGLVHFKGSRMVYLFDLAPDGCSFAPNPAVPTIDFKSAVSELTGNWGCGSWRPHGGVFKQGSHSGPTA
ncbi:hypothetical protein ABPG75_001217 [Micractinium tetrahymenae]